MIRIVTIFCFCLFHLYTCKPAELCNSSDTSSRCGFFTLVLQKSMSNNPSILTKTPTCSPCKLFVTATQYNAALLGIVGADNKCAIDSNKPLTGVYKALIVDDVNRRACTSANCTVGGESEHIDWVIAPNTNYESINTLQFVFTSDANGVYTNNLISTLSAPTGIWTGIRNNPSWDWQTDTSHTCSAWTDNITASCGTYGVTSWQDSRAIAITSAYGNGSTLNNLLCVEQ